MAQPHVLQSWRVSPPPGYGGNAMAGAASDPGATASTSSVQTTPALMAAAASLSAKLVNQGVPPEYTADPVVKAFQQAYVDAGNTLPPDQYHPSPIDGMYGPNTASALAATLGSNVPVPIPGGGGGPSPQPPLPPPPKPPEEPSSGWSWWEWLLLALGVGGVGALGVRQYRKSHGDAPHSAGRIPPRYARR